MRMPARATLITLFAACTFATPPARAVGRLVDVQVVDRGTGETIAPVFHEGTWWIAGRPGARYGVTVVERGGQRTLSVVSVDGVNAISGDTAAWDQTGYVLDPYQRTRIDGWRKNMNEIAAFEFTALPDAYATRTGRPANVGVIGIATFTERRRPTPILRRDVAPAAGDAARPEAPPPPVSPAPSSMPAPAVDAPPAKDGLALAKAESSERRARLGTGHGAIESSAIEYVSFVRARSTPDEIVTIRYDRAENLIAMGILPAPPNAAGRVPDPFPRSGRFVADPPPR